MKIHELELKAKKDKKRLGRGIGSGQGKTAGRGTKGQNSRTGGGVRVGFEGGQTQLSRRLPKLRGFKAKNPTTYQVVNVGDLAKLKAGKVSGEALAKAGLVKKADGLIKLLSSGEVTAAYKLEVNAASAEARKKVEAAGGSIELVAVKAPKQVPKTTEV